MNPAQLPAKLSDLVAKNFPDRRSAAQWLRSPCPGLGGKIPARLAKTQAGRAEVKAFLIGMGWGNFM